MKIFAFFNVKSRERLECAADGVRGFSSSLYKRKLRCLHLLVLLLTSDYDQGEERKHHPSFQKSLHLYRQQVGSRPSAHAVRTAALLHSRVPEWELFRVEFACCPRHSVSGVFSQPKDMHAMLIGHSKQPVKGSLSASSFQ